MDLLKIREQYAAGTLDKPEFIERSFTQGHKTLYAYCNILKESDIKSITIEEDGIIFDTKDDIKIFSDMPDKRIAPIETLNFNHYEEDVTNILLAVIKPGMTVLDIGANIGWYSLLIAKAFDDITIHAFEPVKAIHQKLIKNIELNAFKTIHHHNLGFYDQNTSQEFFYNKEYSSQSSLADLGNIHTDTVMGELVMMDDFMSKQSLNVDVIKCDVEGAELFVFKGASKTITQNLPVIIAEMLRKWAAKFDYHPNDIISYLSSFGYDCYAINEQGITSVSQINDETIETNFVFLHPDKHQSLINILAKV